MFISGFASNINVNRYSFAMVLVSISKNASVQLLDKCKSSMMEISGKICIDIMNMILPSKDMARSAENSKEKDERDNAARNDYAVITPIFSQKRVNFLDTEKKSLYSIHLASLFNNLFNGYDRHMFHERANNALIILFLVFIISIRRRKGRGDIESILGNNLIMQKKVSA